MGDGVTRTTQVEAVEAADRKVCLDVLEGATARRIVVERDATLLGRSEQADVRFDIEGVSRKHARISRVGTASLSLIDLGAKNGTFLNGDRIDVAALHHGDVVQIGPVSLRVAVITTDSPNHPDVRTQLSPREWEVAVHVASGRTNVEVGEALGISRRTVATHLERIYERLGIHSRAALAQMVATSGV